VGRSHTGELLALLSDAFVLDSRARLERERGGIERVVTYHALATGHLQRRAEGAVRPTRLAMRDNAVAEGEAGNRVVSLGVPFGETQAVGVETFHIAEVPTEGIDLVDHQIQDNSTALFDIGEPGRALHHGRIEAATAHH